jgi:hypothetical protein
VLILLKKEKKRIKVNEIFEITPELTGIRTEASTICVGTLMMFCEKRQAAPG